MSELLNLIYERKTVRSFTNESISKSDIESIAKAAVCAPTAKNRQCWHFSVISDREKIEQLAAAVRSALGRDEGYNFYKPAVMIITSAPRDYSFGVDDCACAMENIYLASQALNIGCVWINQLRDCCDDKNVRELLNKYGVPEDHVVYGSAALGKIAVVPVGKERNMNAISYV